MIKELMMKYLSAEYKDGARGENGKYDCWGLVRIARHEIYGMELLPSRCGELRLKPKEFTRHFQEQAKLMRMVDAKPAAIAAVLSGRLCTHVALVTHDITRSGKGLHVLEINPDIAARWIPISEFERYYYGREIIYYAD